MILQLLYPVSSITPPCVRDTRTRRYPLLCTVFYVNSKAKDLLLQSRNITIFKPFLTQTISVTFLQNIASAGTFFFLLQIIGPTHVDFTAYHPDQTLFDLELILCG